MSRRPMTGLGVAVASALALAMAATTAAHAAPPPAGTAEPTAAATAAPVGQSCDEACLEDFIDQYVDALLAHDPSRLPTAARVRFTENTRPLKFGDGFWATVSRIGPYRHVFSEPAAGQAVLFAAMEENGNPGLFTLRLKIRDRQIAEVETLVVRQQVSKFLNTAPRTVKPVFDEALAPLQRRSRTELVAAVNPYFDGLIHGTATGVPLDADCNRTENGVQTTHQKAAPGAPTMIPGHPEINLLGMGCREQFESGYFRYIHEVSPRRFLLVDEARGLVFGMFLFHHPGNITQVDMPGVGVVPMWRAALYPFDVEVAELFKVKDGRIREIEAQMISLPYRSDTGWDP